MEIEIEEEKKVENKKPIVDKTTTSSNENNLNINDSKKREEDEEKKSINVMDESFLNKHMNKQTAGSSENVFTGDENKDKKEKENKEEPSREKRMEDMDYDDIADFLMEGLDWGVSKLSAYVAEESDSKNFEVKDEKLNKLKRQFSKILEKHDLRLSPEVLFAFTAILVFKSPVEKAFKVKKLKKKKKKEKDEVKRRSDKAKGDKKTGDSKSSEPIEDAEVISED